MKDKVLQNKYEEYLLNCRYPRVSFPYWFRLLEKYTEEELYEFKPKYKTSPYQKYKAKIGLSIPIMPANQFHYHHHRMERGIDYIIQLQKEGKIQVRERNSGKKTSNIRDKILKKRIELGHPVI